MTMIIDMFSGTGELGRAVAAGIDEPTQILSLSDNYGPARKYLKRRFPGIEVHKDFRDQDVPEGSIVTIGAPCQDLSVAGKHAGAERGSGTRSSLIHEALDKGIRGEPEYVLSTVHYFFVWPVESVMRVRADNHLLRKKGSH